MSIEKPEIDFPGGEPPADLEIKDIWEGDGPVAQAGQTVTVHYVASRSAPVRSSTPAGTGAPRSASRWARAVSSRAGTWACRA